MTSKAFAVFRSIFTGPDPRRIADWTLEFFRLEAAGGIVLVIASVIALTIANTPLNFFYDYFFNIVHFRVGFSDAAGGNFELRKTLLEWVNDGLMAVFFLLAGLEIKRELTVGELASPRKALLPLFAAIGGMAVPALVYVAINWNHPETLRGWAIPCATDIAFALAVLSLLGDRVPVSLKILLTALAILDDMGSIMIIAFFYSEHIHLGSLLYALVPLAGLLLLNRKGIAGRAPYILLGIVLWILVLKSGLHATIAGVITALFIPVTMKQDSRSPAQRLEHDLHPWVVFLILPLFGFANAGVSFAGLGPEVFTDPLTLGIIFGLVVGKQAGIFGSIWLAVKSGLCTMPEGAGWRQIYAMSLICGIGFTMSLFIGGLAFSGIESQAEVRIGVLCGSVISAAAGYLLFRKITLNQR